MHGIKIIIPGNFQGINGTLRLNVLLQMILCTSMKETIEYFLFKLVII